MTKISIHHLTTHTTGLQTIMVSKTAKFVKAAMDPGFSNRMLVMHEITTRADHVEWDYKVTAGLDPLPEGYERMDSVVTNAGTVLHILRKIPVETEENNFHVDIDAINQAEEKVAEPTTETIFHFEASHSGRLGDRVKLSGECKFDGIFLLLERFSEASPGEQGAFVKKLIDNHEARQVGGGYSLEMFTADKWVEVKAKRDAEWAEFLRSSGDGYAVG